MINNTSDFRVDTYKPVLNIENAADLLGISKATVRNWIKSGQLPAHNKNNSYFFYRADIEKIKSKLLSGELEKLNKRANKIKAKRRFIPEEHFKAQTNLDEFNSIINFIQNNNIKTTMALFLLSLNFLKKEKLLLKINFQDIEKGRELLFANKQIQKEINSWLLDFRSEITKSHFSFLLNCKLPEQRDILGVFYQSLLYEGAKSQSGSYYTPSNRVNDIIKDYVKKDSKVLDPCCGTGQFLLAFADIVENPLNIYGIDYDKTAVRIARLNLLIRFKNKKFAPNIFLKNTLFDIESEDLFNFHNSKDTNSEDLFNFHSSKDTNSEDLFNFHNSKDTNSEDLFNFHNSKDIKDFDVIATNPPWGVHFSKAEAKRLKKLYPQITSMESFSYFLIKSLRWLRRSGVVSFILPESVLNVRTHKDIREMILKTAQIKKIIYLNRIFKNVFTPVIRLDLEKNSKKTKPTTIYNTNKKYKARQIKWMSNHDFIFDIHSSNFDSKIIEKIYKTKHTTLKNQASWALGIVTGNNKRFITAESKPGFEPIYKGKDIKKFILDKPSSYIQFQPEKFQQTAPEKKYRAKEKLIYKFISKNLIFAYDNHKRLTLNSANILIPEIPDYPIKVIASLFNSSLYQFLFQKKFSSIKILRSHIEELPLPLWDKKTFSKIIKLADQVIKNQSKWQELDSYITNKFSLLKKEKNYLNEEKQ